MGKISPKSKAFVLKLVERGFEAREIFDKFRQDNWRYDGIKSLVRRVKKTSSIERKKVQINNLC